MTRCFVCLQFFSLERYRNLNAHVVPACDTAAFSAHSFAWWLLTAVLIIHFAGYKHFAVLHPALPYSCVSPQGLLTYTFHVNLVCLIFFFLTNQPCYLSLLQYKTFLSWLIVPTSNYRLHVWTRNEASHARVVSHISGALKLTDLGLSLPSVIYRM